MNVNSYYVAMEFGDKQTATCGFILKPARNINQRLFVRTPVQYVYVLRKRLMLSMVAHTCYYSYH
jgi:hypothetical protein